MNQRAPSTTEEPRALAILQTPSVQKSMPCGKVIVATKPIVVCESDSGLPIVSPETKATTAYKAFTPPWRKPDQDAIANEACDLAMTYKAALIIGRQGPPETSSAEDLRLELEYI